MRYKIEFYSQEILGSSVGYLKNHAIILYVKSKIIIREKKTISNYRSNRSKLSIDFNKWEYEIEFYLHNYLNDLMVTQLSRQKSQFWEFLPHSQKVNFENFCL